MSPSGVGGVGGGKVKVGSGGPASVKDQLLPVSSQPLLGRILDWERGPDQSEDDSGSGASLLRPSLMPSAGPRLCRPCTGHTGHTGSYFSELKMNVASWGGCGHRQVTPGIWEAMKAGLRQNSAKTDGWVLAAMATPDVTHPCGLWAGHAPRSAAAPSFVSLSVYAESVGVGGGGMGL